MTQKKINIIPQVLTDYYLWTPLFHSLASSEQFEKELGAYSPENRLIELEKHDRAGNTPIRYIADASDTEKLKIIFKLVDKKYHVQLLHHLSWAFSKDENLYTNVFGDNPDYKCLIAFCKVYQVATPSRDDWAREGAGFNVLFFNLFDPENISLRKKLDHCHSEDDVKKTLKDFLTIYAPKPTVLQQKILGKIMNCAVSEKDYINHLIQFGTAFKIDLQILEQHAQLQLV